MKYLRVLWRIVRMSWMYDMIYKTDLIIGYATSVIYISSHIVLIWLFFNVSGVDKIVGYSRSDFYLVFILAEVIWFMMFALASNNTSKFFNQVHFGELDLLLTRPFNSIFLISFQQVYLTNVLVAIFYFAILVGLLTMWGYSFAWWQWLLLVFIMLIAVLTTYLFLWIGSLIAFFFDRFKAVRWLFVEISDAEKYPKKLYPVIMQNLMFYLLPVFLIGNPLFNLIDGSFSWQLALRLVSVALMLGFLFLVLWKEGLRRYSSAA